MWLRNDIVHDVSGKADGHTDLPLSTGTHPIQNEIGTVSSSTQSSNLKQITGKTETGTVSSSTQSSILSQTTGKTETGTVSSSTQSSNLNQTTGSNETGTVSSSTQSSSSNQTAGDTPTEPPPNLSIFLVNDLQYDIFPVHQENGIMCDTDPGKYPSMGFHVQMVMRIEVRSLGM